MLKITISGVDLAGSSVLFEICSPNNPNSAIYSCRETDDNINIEQGIIFVSIPPETEGYSLVTGYKYLYGVTIILADATELRLQGDWTVIRRVGSIKGRRSCTDITLNLSDATIKVDLAVGAAGPQGEQGDTGPAGPPGTAGAGDTNLPAAEEIKGMLRYREPAEGGSVFSVCMRKKDGTYVWNDLLEEV